MIDSKPFVSKFSKHGLIEQNCKSGYYQKRQKTAAVSSDMEKREHLYINGGDTN